MNNLLRIYTKKKRTREDYVLHDVAILSSHDMK
jgi:hypothetical protein